MVKDLVFAILVGTSHGFTTFGFPTFSVLSHLRSSSFHDQSSTTVLPRLLKPLLAKKEFTDEEIAVAARQRVLTDAMNLLTAWDEEQSDFNDLYADSAAPLGDWRGLRKVLNDTERTEMQKACKVLCEDASFVLIGFNADRESEARIAVEEWLTALELPKPPEIPYMDDICGIEYRSLDELPDEFRNALEGPVHVAYNSKAWADPVTADDTLAPPKAHMMPYPAADRGVVFTPILEGYFTQYGDVPLDLFSPNPRRHAAAVAQAPAELAAMQHAALGSAEAAGWLARQTASSMLGAAPPPEVLPDDSA